jgi:drug/metabolite transporter (DMT)-like permease
MPRRLPLPELALFALTLAWGLSFVVIPWALKDAGYLSLTFLRSAVGVAALLALRPKAFAATQLEWRAGLLGGAFLAVGYVMQTGGLTEAASGKSGFLTSLYIPLVPVFEAAVYRRWPQRRDLAAVALAVAGITVMVLRADLTISSGEWLVAVSALFWAGQIVVVGRVADRVDPIRLAAIQLLVVAAVGGAGALFEQERAVNWSPSFVACVLFLGLLTNALGFLTQAWAQRRVPPTRTAVLFSAEPVFAAIFGVWLAGEAFGLRELAGAVLVMAAVAIAVVKPGSDAAPASTGG